MSEITSNPTPTLARDQMTLHFNGAALTFAADTSLADLLDRYGIAQASAATAVNGAFIPRELRAQHRLQAGDNVLTFQAIVGG
jgi:sulfur carrier protein